MNAQPSDQQRPAICPYLGAESSNQRPMEAIDYPSFENRCWSGTRPIPLLLTDQATLCLCNGYRNCPRFIAVRVGRQGYEMPTTAPAPPVDSDAITQALEELEADVEASGIAETKSRRRWGWIGAGLIFMSSLLCGGFFAAYIGWQMVSEEFRATLPGNVDTLAASSAEPQLQSQPQLYLIVTATSEPQAEIIDQAPNQLPAEMGTDNSPGNSQTYPQAVLPTPAPEGMAADPAQPPPSLAEIAQASNENAIAQEPNPTPILDFGLEVPTRRPTPILDIPTSTPSAAEVTATLLPTATPVPPLGTPVVLFNVEDTWLEPGDCTTVTWMVENVSAVYYENLGVDGHGEHEECMTDRNKELNLMIIAGNGATQFYTLTVDMVKPTNTPESTPTRTEEPLPTPTWTPNIPTETSTPPTLYGVQLEAGDSTEIGCDRGTTCELDFYASNTGSAIDNITIRFTEAAMWPRQLCRLDGVCSESEMTLVNIGPSSTGVVRLRVTIPEDAETVPMTYRLQAVSEQSGGEAQSNPVTVQITATDPSAEQVDDQAIQQATEQAREQPPE
jgi:hypothetical protein